MDNKITIAITDDHPLTRQGIKSTLNSVGGFEVTVETSSGPELIEYLQQSGIVPDICILGMGAEGLSGYDTLKEVKKKWGGLKILIFSMLYDEFFIHEMIKSGANGYLEKTSTTRQLMKALASIYYDDYYFSESIAKSLFDQHKRQLVPGITEREMEFLRHCCSELHYKEIAEKMGVSPRTIETFRDALFAKFNLKTRTGLAMFAINNGIVSVKKQKPGKE